MSNVKLDRPHLIGIIAEAIKSRLHEEIVEEILPKPTISELEKMIAEAEEKGTRIGTLLPTGEILKTRLKPVFADDLADACISAIYAAKFEIVPETN